jgi:ribosomal protein S1
VCVWCRVQLSYLATGRIDALEASNDPIVLNDLDKHFVVGQSLELTALSVDSSKKYASLSLLSPTAAAKGKSRLAVSRLVVDAIVVARIVNFTKMGIAVKLPHEQLAFCRNVDVSDVFEENFAKNFAIDQVCVRACVRA